jgi:hypothetical protein
METSFLDVTILIPFVGILTALISLAVFDFYAFSPRPSGIAKRSRELAPMVTIAIAMGIAALSLHLHSLSGLEGLTSNGANDAMRTLQAERIRLFSYPLVVTSAFESLAFGLSLLISAYFLVTRIGLLGWSLVVVAITLMNGVVAVVANPAGLNYGPFELILGLMVSSTYGFSRQRSSRKNEKLELMGLATMIGATAIAGALTHSPLRPELLISAMLIAVSLTAFLFHIAKVAGPHWEATSLFFVTGLAVFVFAGFTLATAPRNFDREQWNAEVVASRTTLQEDLANTIRPIELGARLSPENEYRIAKRLGAGATRLKYLRSTAELSARLETSDLQIIAELKSIEQMIIMLKRLHESRALVADTERRTSAATISSTDSTRADPMAEFWQKDRPWLIAELQKLKEENPSTYIAFTNSMEADLDRLTRAAVEVEIHRVDVWVDWAARQPRELVPSLRQTATNQIARLDELVVVTEPLPLRKDSRFYTLHQNLRKMASVSEANWE